ncbi:hypothetical protein H8E77_40685 [bacterium]|nr:hypothetical protein [bacterium]
MNDTAITIFSAFFVIFLFAVPFLGYVYWLTKKDLKIASLKLRILKNLYEIQRDSNKYKYCVPTSKLKKPPQKIMGIAAEDFNWLIEWVKEAESRYSGVWLGKIMADYFFVYLEIKYLAGVLGLPDFIENQYVTKDLPDSLTKEYEWARWFHKIVRDILDYESTIMTIGGSINNKFQIEVWHSGNLNKKKIMEALKPKPIDYYDE